MQTLRLWHLLVPLWTTGAPDQSRALAAGCRTLARKRDLRPSDDHRCAAEGALRLTSGHGRQVSTVCHAPDGEQALPAAVLMTHGTQTARR